MDFVGNGMAWPLLAWGIAGVIILAGAVAVDARERGQAAALWFVLALLFPGFGALAYLVLRPAAEAASLPVAGLPDPAASLPDRPTSAPDRPPSAPLSAASARGSVPLARPEPSETPPAPREPARAPGTAETAHGGTMEWRRGVGVLPAAATPPLPPVTEPQARPEVRGGRGLPPWLLGAAAAVLLLAVIGFVALPRLGGLSGPPPPTPTAVPSPTAVPALDVAPAPAAATEAPPERPSSYTVEDGDTLGGIAAQFGTSVQAIMEANGIDDPDTVFVGQQLALPPQ
jgi:LysM repeat protein